MRSNHNQNNSLHDNTTINNIGPVSQVVSGMAHMNLMNENLRNQKPVYNTKFTGAKSGSDVKSTPQHMISSKIGNKQGNRGD